MSRGLNLNNSNSKLISAADYGGQRLLGLNYSLTNWINTGNMTKIDSFEKTETKKSYLRRALIYRKAFALVANVY